MTNYKNILYITYYMNFILDKIYEEQIKICKSIQNEQNIQKPNVGTTIGCAVKALGKSNNNDFYSLTGCISYKKKNN